MKILSLLFFTLSINTFGFNLYENSIEGIKGKIDFSKLKGKSVLLVNIATRCGYTGQLDDLEKLYQNYKKKGFVVVGVPSNDFGGQTPEGEAEVAKFCRLKYGVTFPLSKKMIVKGDKKSKFIKNIIDISESKDEIGWNFEKFLFDKKGQLVKRYDSAVKPNDSNLKNDIEKVIN